MPTADVPAARNVLLPLFFKKTEIFKMSSRPWMKFYPSDWLGSSRLRRCSFAARGLAIELICHMHQGEPYGHLTVKGNAAVARLVGMSSKKLSQTLPELIQNDIILESQTGALFSPRMVRDYEKSLKRQADGGLGGNPALKQVVKPEDKPSDTRYQIPDTRKEERGPRPKRTRSQLDPNWIPTEEDKKYARERGIREEQIEPLGSSFKNHHLAKGSVMADWHRAWCKWCDNEINWKGKNSGFRESRIQGDSRSASRAAAELADKAKRGEFTFGPRPGLSVEPGAATVRLLPKG